MRWTDFPPWNFRAEDGFAAPGWPKFENLAFQRRYSSFWQGYPCFSPRFRPARCCAKSGWNFGLETSLVSAVRFAASAARFAQKGGAEWSEEGFFAPVPLSAEPIGFPSKGRWRRQPTDEVASFLLHDAMAVTDNKARLLCHQAAAKIRAPPHPPHSRSAPSPRGEGFACSFSQPQPTQKTAGRTMRPAVPG